MSHCPRKPQPVLYHPVYGDPADVERAKRLLELDRRYLRDQLSAEAYEAELRRILRCCSAGK